ncbi:adenylate/guanylate cyclase domain-containing protein [Nordella sp. HKS 07]|uniref:adenylate/guanylate cyclase domain-containing protein n=1 Tax=Nordella sp. HKS 07 TaxID=2712222 RepID=UPI0013E1B062|nr:adenylate/guanylate cyclase domain-containing protein [Nordella sp. HKS 07]QIG49427.1 adenylate/guanylate cyclase domain-containing protein [Nordella sp. HKS 07]
MDIETGELTGTAAAVEAQITTWLIGPARRSCTPVEIVNGLVERLVGAGIPLWRVRIAQQVANPLIAAWGAMWTRDAGAELYTVPRGMLRTNSFYGSPFEHVIKTRTKFRKSLARLEAGRDHEVLFELAAAGGTEYLALPVEYGDGSVQASAFTTDRPDGFHDEEALLIERLMPALAAAMEPAAMRHSMASLLEVYLGTGPAGRVAGGAFHRGAMTEIDAVVMLTDLRGFTDLSERLAPDRLLQRLGAYFEIVVEAVRSEGGDVLKFIGDGVLALFSVDGAAQPEACARAVRSTTRAFTRNTDPELRFVSAIHMGPVVYGNIGSLDRLDFTVVGPTVNYVSRLESAAKLLDKPAICSAAVARWLPASMVESLGHHQLKGFSDPQMLYELKTAS